MRGGDSRNFGANERGETAVPFEVGPERDQPDQSGRAGDGGAYPSEVEARSPASRDSIGQGESTDDAVAARTKSVVARPRPPLAMAAALPEVL